ncbi:serine-rich adhesin for platelets-like [Ambystoma mexicanum]|uniref:serine-rich adhesin for platelets-like n=1 Tax=Ambystoma mexicanum TaxID=8296 RepID=UPI0037E9B4B3
MTAQTAPGGPQTRHKTIQQRRMQNPWTALKADSVPASSKVSSVSKRPASKVSPVSIDSMVDMLQPAPVSPVPTTVTLLETAVISSSPGDHEALTTTTSRSNARAKSAERSKKDCAATLVELVSTDSQSISAHKNSNAGGQSAPLFECVINQAVLGAAQITPKPNAEKATPVSVVASVPDKLEASALTVKDVGHSDASLQRPLLTLTNLPPFFLDSSRSSQLNHTFQPTPNLIENTEEFFTPFEITDAEIMEASQDEEQIDNLTALDGLTRSAMPLTKDPEAVVNVSLLAEAEIRQIHKTQSSVSLEPKTVTVNSRTTKAVTPHSFPDCILIKQAKEHAMSGIIQPLHKPTTCHANQVHVTNQLSRNSDIASDYSHRSRVTPDRGLTGKRNQMRPTSCDKRITGGADDSTTNITHIKTRFHTSNMASSSTPRNVNLQPKSSQLPQNTSVTAAVNMSSSSEHQIENTNCSHSSPADKITTDPKPSLSSAAAMQIYNNVLAASSAALLPFLKMYESLQEAYKDQISLILSLKEKMDKFDSVTNFLQSQLSQEAEHTMRWQERLSDLAARHHCQNDTLYDGLLEAVKWMRHSSTMMCSNTVPVISQASIRSTKASIPSQTRPQNINDAALAVETPSTVLAANNGERNLAASLPAPAPAPTLSDQAFYSAISAPPKLPLTSFGIFEGAAKAIKVSTTTDQKALLSHACQSAFAKRTHVTKKRASNAKPQNFIRNIMPENRLTSSSRTELPKSSKENITHADNDLEGLGRLIAPASKRQRAESDRESRTSKSSDEEIDLCNLSTYSDDAVSSNPTIGPIVVPDDVLHELPHRTNPDVDEDINQKKGLPNSRPSSNWLARLNPKYTRSQEKKQACYISHASSSLRKSLSPMTSKLRLQNLNREDRDLNLNRNNVLK